MIGLRRGQQTQGQTNLMLDLRHCLCSPISAGTFGDPKTLPYSMNRRPPAGDGRLPKLPIVKSLCKISNHDHTTYHPGRGITNPELDWTERATICLGKDGAQNVSRMCAEAPIQAHPRSCLMIDFVLPDFARMPDLNLVACTGTGETSPNSQAWQHTEALTSPDPKPLTRCSLETPRKP